jgi:hypothetical protein
MIALASLHIRGSCDFARADNPALKYAEVAYVTQVEMHFNVVAATIPCLRILLKSLNTGFLGTVVDPVDASGMNMATKGSGKYELSVLKRTPKMQAGWRGVASSTICAPSHDKVSLASDSSNRRIMVRETYQVSIE